MKERVFLDLLPGNQKIILNFLKNKLNITWVELSQIIRVNKSMIFFYCNDVCKMPLAYLIKLCFLSNQDLDEFELKTKTIPYCNKNNIVVPNKSVNLAEFIGVLYGDGCISKTSYSINVTCDAVLDKKYIEQIVIPFFKNLFDLNPKTRVQNGAVNCWVNSKSLFEFLSKLNFPVGKKKNKLIIPSWIIENEGYSIAFIRGLFDTDGGVHRHHKNSIQIGFTSNSPDFLKDVFNLMKKIGLNPKLGKKDIWFFGNSAKNFFAIIKPHNSKHLFKFNQFKINKKVPLSKEMYARAGIRTQVTA